MLNFFIRIVLLAAAALAWGGAIFTASAAAGGRVALIVGNAQYEHASMLANSLSDADAVAGALNKSGFDIVDERRNVGVLEFKRALREFAQTTSAADIAVVYYSGHGIEVGGVNYLVPVDAKVEKDSDVDDETVSLDRILQAAHGAKRLTLIILDTCRGNPFLHPVQKDPVIRSTVNSLAVQATGSNTLIAYSAKPGSASCDADGQIDAFANALVKYIAAPGVDLRAALGQVRDDVLKSTGNRQEPFVYGSLGGNFVSLLPIEPTKAAKPDAPDESGLAIAREYESAERIGSLAAWQAFLALHNSDYYADLARAQIEKFSTTNQAKPGPVASSPTAPKQREVEAKQASQDPPKSPTPEKTASAPVDKPGIDANRTCRAEAAQLAQLRQNASVEEAKRFSSELTCSDLRPQVDLLLESLGVVAAIDQPAVAGAAGAPNPSPSQLACEREADELERLRADPSREIVQKFKQAMACESLKAQTDQLLASLSDYPTKVAAPQAIPATNPATRKANPPVPVAEIETELRRVGCYVGTNSADIGQSVSKYAQHVGLSLAQAGSDRALLDSLKRQTNRVCPLECPARQVARNGRCVVTQCARGELMSRDGGCIARSQSRPAAATPETVDRPPAARTSPCLGSHAQDDGCPLRAAARKPVPSASCAGAYHLDASGACQSNSEVVDGRCQKGFVPVGAPTGNGYRCVSAN